MGLSLGASVALAAGSQNARVSAIADWYGSLPDDFLPKLKGMPPLLILHGNRDDVIPIINAQQLVRLCGMEHFACESHFYQDQGHGFMKGALEDADARTLDFFARTMK
jgi:carboxymethylenebutenolidase